MVFVRQPLKLYLNRLNRLLLYGSGSEKVMLTYTTPRRRKRVRNTVFEGIVANMTRRYQERKPKCTKELAKFAD